jgi:hypothetical protein
MLRSALFVLLCSVTITLLGAWAGAYFFTYPSSFELRLIIGGTVDGFLYAGCLGFLALFFPNAFFAAFPIAKKAPRV